MTRVLLVDDHAAFREPLAFMLDRDPDLDIVAQAGSLTEARSLLHNIDLAVVDLDLPDGTGVDLVKELRAINPYGMVLVLSASVNQKDLAEAVEAGAAGILHKSSRIDDIIAAIRRLIAGEPLLSPTQVIEMLRLATRERERNREAEQALAQLTPRERDVLQALAEGLSDKEIAQQLFISTETVRTHMVNILGKLGVESRLQALVFALRHGAVTVD